VKRRISSDEYKPGPREAEPVSQVSCIADAITKSDKVERAEELWDEVYGEYQKVFFVLLLKTGLNFILWIYFLKIRWENDDLIPVKIKRCNKKSSKYYTIMISKRDTRLQRQLKCM